MINYIITNHAKQRRPHHQITEDKVLKQWLKAFDDKFTFSKFKIGGSYKIYSKWSNCVILKRKDEKNIILITFRGFKGLVKEISLDTLKCDEIESRDPIYDHVYRINYLGKIVKCGRIYKNSDKKAKYLLSLKSNLSQKYEIENFTEKIYFNSFDEVKSIVFKNKDGKYLLNSFKRKEEF